MKNEREFTKNKSVRWGEMETFPRIFGVQIPRRLRAPRLHTGVLFIAALWLWAPCGGTDADANETPALAWRDAVGEMEKQEPMLLGAEAHLLQRQLEVRTQWSLLGPQLFLLGQYLRQDSPSGLGQTISPADQTTVRLQLKQSIYRGGRDRASLLSSEASLRAAQWGRQEKFFEMQRQLAQAYLDAWVAQQEHNVVAQGLRLMEQRAEQIGGWVKIGRARKADLFSAQSQYSSFKAQSEQLQGRARGAWRAFQVLTRRTKSDAAEDDVPVFVEPPWLETQDPWLVTEGLEKASPKLERFREQSEAIRSESEGLRGGFGGYWAPEVDVVGQYYLKRPGVLKDVQWDVGLNLSWSLFQSGSHWWQSEALAAKVKVAEFEWQREGEQLALQLDQLRESLRGVVRQQKWLEDARDQAKKQYDALAQDAVRGLATSLEVLQAASQRIEAERAVVRLRGERARLGMEIATLKGERL